MKKYEVSGIASVPFTVKVESKDTGGLGDAVARTLLRIQGRPDAIKIENIRPIRQYTARKSPNIRLPRVEIVA